MESIWSKNTELSQRKPLSGNISTEVAVIGAGMAGILTAYLLKKKGKEVIVLEGDRIAGGQTKNTTAKITSQHGNIYEQLIEKVGFEKAKLYLDANEKAISCYKEIIKENNIDCDFEIMPAYLYTGNNLDKLKIEQKALAMLGKETCLVKENELPFKTAGALRLDNQAQFSPLKFIKQLSSKIEIYEKTRVISVKGNKIKTNRGIVTAENVVFATHYPFINIPGFYFLRQHQERSYVIALKADKKLNGMYYSIDNNGISLRGEGETILFGGGTHRTGEKKKKDVYEALKKEAETYYPEYKEITRWSAQDCMPHDDIPFIGKYSIFKPHWYIATGFKKWGMTSSMIAAMIISDSICGKNNPYEQLFKPQRCNVKASIKNLLTDIKESIKGLSKGHFHIPVIKKNSIQKGHAGIIREGFKRAGCYIDENGVEHKISVKCPHMGCELRWNPSEHTWDCPCHGSRFDYDGELIDNPAQVTKRKS